MLPAPCERDLDSHLTGEVGEIKSLLSLRVLLSNLGEWSVPAMLDNTKVSFYGLKDQHAGASGRWHSIGAGTA